MITDSYRVIRESVAHFSSSDFSVRHASGPDDDTPFRMSPLSNPAKCPLLFPRLLAFVLHFQMGLVGLTTSVRWFASCALKLAFFFFLLFKAQGAAVTSRGL
jgi:hypothetical protein